MNRYVTEFVGTVLGQIKYKKAHDAISKELNCHICELAEAYSNEGLTEEEAFSRAVLQMGDPVEIGRRLHRTHRPKTEWSVIILLTAIVAFGLLAISLYSSLYLESIIFYKQLLFTVLGILVLIFCCFFDYTRLEKYSFAGYFITCFLMLMAIMFGSHINGRSYVVIAGFGFFPVIAAIPLLLISFAGLVKRWCDGNTKNLLMLIGSAGLPLIIILLEPSTAYFLIVGASLLTMITFGICSKNYTADRKRTLLFLYGSLLGMAILFLIHMFVLNPYRMDRLAAFFKPESYSLGEGYIYVLIKNITSSAVLIGDSGLFTGTAGKGEVILPDAHSQFILIFIISKMGWAAAISLVLLMSLIILRLFLSSVKIIHDFGRCLCVGICCVFALQVIANVLMNLRIFPTLAVTLPLISYGGGAHLLNMALIGLFLGVYRRKDIFSVKV